MGWLGVTHAWMGNGDAARDAIINGWVAGGLKTNGFFTELPRDPDKRASSNMMQNQLCGFGNVVNEMLLQSHSDVIQVFPAIPKDWADVGFYRMRANGAFVVSAKRRKGKVEWVTIESEKGGDCVLKNPWQGVRKVYATCMNPEHEPTRPVTVGKDEMIRLRMKKGQTYQLGVRSEELGVRNDILESKPYPEKPWAVTVPALSKEKTWTVTWGK